jgi:hypothetical protein
LLRRLFQGYLDQKASIEPRLNFITSIAGDKLNHVKEQTSRKRVAKEAIRGSYDDAVETIRDTTGCSIAEPQSQNVVKDIAQDFEDYYQQNELSKR